MTIVGDLILLLGELGPSIDPMVPHVNPLQGSSFFGTSTVQCALKVRNA
jgi:hypothetical protein